MEQSESVTLFVKLNPGMLSCGARALSRRTGVPVSICTKVLNRFKRGEIKISKAWGEKEYVVYREAGFFCSYWDGSGYAPFRSQARRVTEIEANRLVAMLGDQFPSFKYSMMKVGVKQKAA